MGQWSVRAFLLLLCGCLAGCATPAHTYLTWQGDTSTTMTVNFHTLAEGPSEVFYDTTSHGGEIAAYAKHAVGAAHQIPGLKDKRWVHVVELRDLVPGARYYFAVSEGDATRVRERQFRTLPNDGSTIRFVDGGDVSALPAVAGMFQRAAAFSPHFVEIGGDIAYEGGNLALAPLYDRWLKLWVDNMVTPEGDTIPIIAAIGNHECNDRYAAPEQNAPFYFGYFAQGGASNFARALGPNAVLIALDSGHAQTWAAQVPWLDDVLTQNAATPFTLATYHVPLYPSYRPYDGGDSVQGRTHWLPVFDGHGLTAAFEHHDHTFKRSKLLRGGAVDPDGTLYLGDGCFGQLPRAARNAGAWYLEKADGVRNFWVVDIAGDAMTFQAIGADGTVIDTARITR